MKEKFLALIAAVSPADHSLSGAAQAHLDDLTKLREALGALRRLPCALFRQQHPFHQSSIGKRSAVLPATMVLPEKGFQRFLRR